MIRRKNLLPRHERGSILIGVLWALFFLGALGVAINAYITPQLNFASRLKDKMDSYYLARAGVMRAIAEIKPLEDDEKDPLKKKIKEPADYSWRNKPQDLKDISLGAGTFSVKYTLDSDSGEDALRYGLVDEESKININTVSKSVLEQFFEIVGKATNQEAVTIAASIIDWRDEDEDVESSGAESGYYMSLETPYRSRNTNFAIREELLLINGVTQEIYQNVADYFTVYGEGLVNINTASSLVLQSLGMGRSLAEKVISYRSGSDGQDATADDVVIDSLDNILQTIGNMKNFTKEEAEEMRAVLSGGFLGVSSNFFEGVSRGTLAEKKFLTTIVFVFGRDKVIRYWQEQ